MTSIDDERKVAEDAKAVLSSLKPSTPRFKSANRHPARCPPRGDERNESAAFESMALVHTRDAAVNALKEVSHEWSNGTLTKEVIFGAKDAVEAWLKALAEA